VASPVRMPPLGQVSDELRLLEWRKREGEAVSEGELLLVIETDKATLDVEASTAGTLLRIDCREGETVTAGTILGWIGEPGEAIVEPEGPAGAEPQVVAAPAPVVSAPVSARVSVSDRVLATPAARMLAKELGVDLAAVTGTGPDGRVERRDVEALARG
jgi:pyruvate dehydrogenase E2 component (dihydrolipoamide acetyltransferase)